MRTQIASAINVVIQVERMEDGRRRMVSLQEIQGMEGEVVTMSEIFRFRRTGIDDKGMVTGQFEATGQVPRFRDRVVQRGMDLPLEFFGGVTLARRRV